MPSYAIHLAVAEEYLRKNKDLKEDHNTFTKGVIYPDTVSDKSMTHYGRYSSQSNLYRFLQENDVNDSFKKGHFLHLLTDYLFYNKYLDYWSKDIYHDYDVLNKKLIEKYHLIVTEEIKNSMLPVEDTKLTILSTQMINQFIEDVSELNIDDIVQEVQNDPEKWTRIRPLKKV